MQYAQYSKKITGYRAGSGGYQVGMLWLHGWKWRLSGGDVVVAWLEVVAIRWGCCGCIAGSCGYQMGMLWLLNGDAVVLLWVRWRFLSGHVMVHKWGCDGYKEGAW